MADRRLTLNPFTIVRNNFSSLEPEKKVVDKVLEKETAKPIQIL